MTAAWAGAARSARNGWAIAHLPSMLRGRGARPSVDPPRRGRVPLLQPRRRGVVSGVRDLAAHRAAALRRLTEARSARRYLAPHDRHPDRRERADPDLLGHPAVRDRPSRQRPGRDPQLRRAPGRVRGDLLHRRLPRADEPPRRRMPFARGRREMAASLLALGLDPDTLHAVRPEPSPRAHRARVAPRDGHAGELARAHADLQGEAREPARRREPRPAHLPGAPGGGHRHLQGDARAGRQGPGGAPRAVTRDRAARSTAATARHSPSRRRSTPRRPWCSAPTACSKM